MADLFHALVAPARRAILDELCDRDGQTLYELCTRLTMKHGMNLTRQAVSQHLDVLEAAGLVGTKREGRYKFHFFNGAPLEGITKRWPASRPKGARK
jgi:DNA-binding transcriptional ArsR family regulator